MEGHTLDEDGFHDEDECHQCRLDEYQSLLAEEVKSECRCGECCKKLIIQALPEDADREPRIKELCSPIYFPADVSESGEDELEGYLLNSREDLACIFLDRATNLCTIYETRPLECRLFDCAGKGREQLIELGVLPRRDGRDKPPARR